MMKINGRWYPLKLSSQLIEENKFPLSKIADGLKVSFAYLFPFKKGKLPL